MKCYIYGLYSTKDNIVRYVGKTKASLNQRRNEHKCDALTRGIKNHKCNWIRSVFENGYKIEIKELEICNENNWEDKERFWIKKLKESNKLVNQLEGGQSGGIGGRLQNYLDYEQAKKYLQNLPIKIKSYKEYKDFYNKHKNEIINILPKAPQKVYSIRKSWKGWGDFLCDYMNDSMKRHFEFKTFDEIKKLLIEHNIKNRKEYYIFAKDNNAPFHPERTYKKEWKNWRSFLGDDRLIIEDYNMFIKYIKDNFPKISTLEQYRELFDKKLPIPYSPHKTYKKKWSEIKNDLSND